MAALNIFVGCSSKDTSNEIYQQTAEKTGNFIVRGNHNFVFCGCGVGLVGRIYSVVCRSPKSKIFVASAKAYENHLESVSCVREYKLETINQRKDAIFSLSDVLVFLPGGVGTADELLASIEAKRAGEHDLPIVILNEGGFFDRLLAFFKQICDEGFASSKTFELCFVARSFDEAAEYLSNISK